MSKVGFSPLALNIDGFLVCSVPLFIMWCTTSTVYTYKAYYIAAGADVLAILGNSAMTEAIKRAKGGPVSTVDTLKSLVPLVLGIYFF